MGQELKQRIAPGVWVDEDDGLHFSIPEICEHFNVPFTLANQQVVVDMVQELLAERNLPPPEIEYETRSEAVERLERFERFEPIKRKL